MTRLTTKHHIVKMLEDGFVIAPCENEECEQLFSSDKYCVDCEEITK